MVTIEEFLNGTGDMWAWDDFLSVPPRDPSFGAFRGFAGSYQGTYPPTDRCEYCSEEGKARLRLYLERLRSQEAAVSRNLSMRNNLVWRKAVILLLVWMLPAGAQQDQRVLVEAGAK